MDNLLEIVKEIAAASGTAKQAVLRKYAGESRFKDLLHAAYDPTVVFNRTSDGVWDYDPFEGGDGVTNLDSQSPEFWNMLHDLPHSRGSSGLQSIHALTRRFKSPDTTELLARILDKDLKCGIGASTINKVFPDLISEFNVMLAVPFDAAKIVFPSYVEPKFDGMRVTALRHTEGGEWEFLTRTGKAVDSVGRKVRGDLNLLARYLTDGNPYGPLMIDGELMASDFTKTMELARRKGQVSDDLQFHVFDWLPYDAFWKASNTKGPSGGGAYKERARVLRQRYGALKMANLITGTYVQVPPSYLVSSIDELHRIYDSVRERGLEGLIIKHPDGEYRGRRHRDWMKMKAEETLDLEVIGFDEGTNQFEGSLGALQVKHGSVIVKVGTGLTIEQRADIWANRDRYLGKIVEVGYQEQTPDGSLRHPRFMRWRFDKEATSAW